MDNIIEQLNPAQREAVMNFTGPSLIVAGAGSGKTRVLTARIAYMIAQGIAPWNILALTFTNKAAAEMRERIDGMVGGRRSQYIQMGTFHSIFLRILRTEAERIGYPPAFTIYDTTDSHNLVKSICKEMSLADNDKYKPRAVFAKISRLKNDLITPAVYENDPVFTADDRKRGQAQFLEIYKRYTVQCKANGAMDFDDLLLNMVVLLKNNPDVLAKYREKFRYILVDEYQDTNHVQYLIVKALAMAHGNICVVGDDSQSIYSFRGARIENILNFKRDFPAAQVYKLEQNYRSTQVIVNAANSVIARNSSSRELKKECFSAGERGENIKLLRAYTDREEAEMVASEIRSLGRGGVPWDEIAVLYRINALSRNVEEALRRRDVPYKIYRGHSFFDRKEIKDMLAYFRLIVNPRDDEAFKRIVNYPARGIGEVTVGRIAAAAREQGVSMWEVVSSSTTSPSPSGEGTPPSQGGESLRARETPLLPEGGVAAQRADGVVGLSKKLVPFVELIRKLSLERVERSLYDFGREVAIRTGIVGSYKAEGSAEAASALENIDELLNSMVAGEQNIPDREYPAVEDEGPDDGRIPYGMRPAEDSNGSTDSAIPNGMVGSSPALTLEEWLGNVALMTDMDNDEPENRNKVTLMTVHSAKGLEFRHVFIMGLEEELFPSVRDGDSAEIEEERRLFYVALTRAKERSCLSMAEQRFVHGSMTFRRPSRFVREIDGQFLDGGGLSDSRPDAYGHSVIARRPADEAIQKNRDWIASPYRVRNDDKSDPHRVGMRPEKVAPVAPDARFRKLPSPRRNVEGTPPSPDTSTARGDGLHSVDEFLSGTRVRHTKFGHGTVNEVETMAGATGPGDLKITVTFDDPAHGRKTLLSKFAKLEII